MYCHSVKCVYTYICIDVCVCVSVLHTLRIPSVSVEDHVVFAMRDGNWAARNLGLIFYTFWMLFYVHLTYFKKTLF